MALNFRSATDLRVSARDVWTAWSFILLLVAAALLCWAGPERLTGNVLPAWIGLGCFALAAVALHAAGNWLSVPLVYLYVFGAFHLGLAPLLALRWEVPTFGNPSAADWIHQRPVGQALMTVALATLFFAIGARIGVKAPVSSRDNPQLDRPSSENRAALACFTIALIGVGGWYVFTLSRGGLRILTGSYADYLDTASGGILPVLNLLIGFAGALWAVSPRHTLSRKAIVLLVLYAVPALVLGLRGEVLFPLAAGVAVLGKRRRFQGQPLTWLIILVLVLSGIAFIRTLRTTGIARGPAAVDLNPAHGLAELGYSIRPVAEAIAWRTTEGAASGRTYIRPLERAASRFVPTIDVPVATEDQYLMNVRVMERVGPIGFSPVAEGVVNFGVAGAASFMLLVGLVLGWLERRLPTVGGLVLTGALLVPLLIQTRNSFVPVPLGLACGVLIAAYVSRGRRTSTGAQSRKQQPARSSQ